MASDKHLFFSVFASFLCIISACYDDVPYVIKSAQLQALVLDGSDVAQVRLQYFTNSSAQLWKFQSAKPVGYFYIVNFHTGKALDIHPGQNSIVLVQMKKRNTKRQHWSVTMDGRIQNRQINRNVDITQNRNAPGTSISLWHNNGDQAQEFVVDALEDVDFEDLKAWID